MDTRFNIKYLYLSALVFIVLCFTVIAEENVTLKFGSGLNHNPQAALYSLGFENGFKRSKYFHKVDFGFWTDAEARNSSSIFGSFLIGRRFGTLRSLNVSLLAGVLIMSGPDRVLATPFQLTEEVSVGYQRFSIGIKHISNAAIKTPNLGRDFIFFNYTLPISE